MRVFKSGLSPTWPADALPDDIKIYVGPTRREYEPIDSRGGSDLPRTMASSVEHSG